MTRRLAAAVLLAAAPTAAAPRSADADGFRNPFQGAAAIAQGNAFAAQADDPSAIFYNPAGLAWLPGVQAATGVQLVNVRTRFTNQTGERTENHFESAVGLPPPGQLFLTANVGDLGLAALSRLTVGLGIPEPLRLRHPRSGRRSARHRRHRGQPPPSL